MQEKITIARPYAQAAFDVAAEEGNLAQWSEMLSILATIIADEDMQPVCTDPRVSKEQLQSLVIEVAGDAFSATGKNFVKVLVNAERLVLAPQIHVLFDDLKSEAEKTIQVKVSTAFELTAEQESSIATSMTKRFGRKVELSTIIDKTLIGGAIIRAGDVVIDSSLRGRLQKLASGFS